MQNGNASNTTEDQTIAPLAYVTITVGPALHLLAVILIIIQRNKQPIKSRIPKLMIITIIGESLLLLTFVRLAVGKSIYPCFLFVFGFFIPTPLIFFPLFWRCHTYVSICWLSQFKVHMDEKKYKKIAFLISTRLLFIVMAAVFVIHIALYIINLFSSYNVADMATGTNCKLSVGLYITEATELALFLLPIIGFIIYMCVSKAVKDRYYIKLELILCTTVYFVTIVAVLAFAALVAYVPAIKPADRYVSYAYIIVVGVIANDIICIWTPIIASFFNKKYTSLQEDNDVLRDVMNDPKLSLEFRKYLIQSFAPEMYMFWVDYQAYRKLEDPVIQYELGVHLCNKYLDENSPMQLNLENISIRREKIQESLKTFQQQEMSSESTEPSPINFQNLFDDIFTDCEIDLAAHMSTFTKNVKFQKKKTVRELEEKIGVV
jgi:uncharacterized membrane protein YqjE